MESTNDNKERDPRIPADGRFTSEYQPNRGGGNTFSSENQPEYNPGRPQKFDYDSDEFVQEIFALAFNGLSNDEIADGLENRFGFGLAPSTFKKMLNGRYENWSKEENERRSTRYKSYLERARRKTNSLVRGRFLKMALGGIKTKHVSTVKRRLRIDGELTDNEEIQTTTQEIESAPSLQALSVWLYHFDPEWRKRQQGKHDEEEDPSYVPNDISKGIDITQWIDQEVKEKELRSQDVSSEEPKAEDPDSLSNMESAGV